MVEHNTKIERSKSFLTVGPTLHYSHRHVYRWMACVITVYISACLFWSKILTGAVESLQISQIHQEPFWSIGKFVTSPVSIYQYPWQILVLGLLMGLLGIVPILVSQLLSSRYCVVLILACAFLAKLPLFAICLTISCIAVASRPIRFRSRFISIALCLVPEVLYWWLSGGVVDLDPIKWGLSYAPWVTAWITSMLIAAIVLFVGHYTRYKPGMVSTVSFITLLGAFFIFENQIGFSELDYQLYVERNNPNLAVEFQPQKIDKLLDKAVKNPILKNELVQSFYPSEPILLREQLKEDLVRMLAYDKWPDWLRLMGNVPKSMRYSEKRNQLLEQYDYFLEHRPNSKRRATALYYKAMISEYSPNIINLRNKEELSFYSDYPKVENRVLWMELYQKHLQSPESLEAAWRVAMHFAGNQNFQRAQEICDKSLEKVNKLLLENEYSTQTSQSQSVFKHPPESAITRLKLIAIKDMLLKINAMLNSQNWNSTAESKAKLAKFIMLNPHSPEYSDHLKRMLENTTENEPLYDNLRLAIAMLEEDPAKRISLLREIQKEFKNQDATTRALFELALASLQLYRNESINENDRKQHLDQARSTFELLIQLYPQSMYSEQAKTKLEGLPKQ